MINTHCTFDVQYPRDSSNRSNLAKRIAHTITSTQNQHVTLIMVGGTGSGKSWAALDLAYQTAYAVSHIMEKNAPDGAWLKFFNLNHMAIITLDRVANLLKNVRSHGIYILDDIGVGYNARDWMKEKNKRMNEIIQTFRTDNTLVIYTVPDREFIDKVPRKLVDRFLEFERNGLVKVQAGSGRRASSFNIFRYFDITTLKRQGHQLYVYDTVREMTASMQFVRHIAIKPPDRLIIPYEKARLEIARELREKNADMLLEGGEDEGGGFVASAAADKLHETLFYQTVQVRKVAETNKTSLREACNIVGISDTKFHELTGARKPQWFTDIEADKVNRGVKT